MNVLLTGATGFIGQAIEHVLIKQGHTVIRGVRRPKRPTDIAVNFEQDTQPAIWFQRLNNIDAVVNAVGVLGGKPNVVKAIHTDTPTALAQAAKNKEIKHFIHVSALGVDSGLDTVYFKTKLAGEHGIRAAMPMAGIIRPSLVFGKQGDSSQLFLQLTHLPLIALPMKGSMMVQPIHHLDVAAAVGFMLEEQVRQCYKPNDKPQTIEAVGTSALTMADYLYSLTEQLQRQSPLKLRIILPMPMMIAKASASIAQCLPQFVWTQETVLMLCANNTANPETMIQLLGRLPIPVNEFIAYG